MGFVPRTPSFTNISFVDSPDPVTGHSYLLHTLRAFVGNRGSACMLNVRLYLTHLSDCLSACVCNLMCHRPVNLILPAYGARQSPLVYPANRNQADGRLGGIHCYQMSSNPSGL